MKKKYKNKNKIKFPIIGALTKGLRSDEMQITNNGSSVVMGM